MSTDTFTYPPLSPYLTVKGANKAIEFYKTAFGATELFRLADTKSGNVSHAELLISGSHIMLADENPAWGNKSPLSLGGTAVTFSLMVDNADKAAERAKAAGATIEMPAADMFYGFRSAGISDPFGHRWMLQHRVEHVSSEEIQKRWDAMLASGDEGCPDSKK